MQHDDLLLAGNLNRNSCHNAFPRPQLLRTKLIPLKLSALALVVHVAVLVAVPPAAAQSPFTPRYSLFDPGTNAQTGALQGSCVAIDGNIAVTGSPEDATGGTLSGAARVYDATTGVLLYRLVNPRASDYDYFGRSVA